MPQIKEYIERIDDMLKNGTDCEQADLVEEVVSVFADSLPKIRVGLDRYKGRVVTAYSTISYDNIGDLKKLRGKLRQKEDEDQRMQDEKYGTSTITEHINKCDEVLKSGTIEDQSNFRYMVCGVYTPLIDGFTHHLDIYGYEDSDPREDIRKDIILIKEKLKVYRDQIIRNANEKPSQNIVTSAISESSANARASVEVNITNTIEAVDNIPDTILSIENKEELIALLQKLDREKSKGKERFKKAGKKVVDFLFDKAIEAIPTVLPYVIQAAQSAS